MVTTVRIWTVNRYRPGQVVLVSEDNGNLWRKCRYNTFVTASTDLVSVTDLKTLKTHRVPVENVFAYHTGQDSGVVLHSRALTTRLKNGGR